MYVLFVLSIILAWRLGKSPSPRTS